jgi:hypothetical protein
MLLPTASFNISRFIDENLLRSLEKFFSARWSSGQRKLGVHIDNAPAHSSRMAQNFFVHNPLKRLLHPSYSPDIPPSDFDLFRKVERALIGREIPDEIDFLEAVSESLNGISDAELQRVFRNWIERLEKVIDAGGDYLTE